jgi:DEAD/DEAH box helicase domain-containing protein
MTCALLLDVMSAMKSHFQAENDWGEVGIRVLTMTIDEGKPLRTRGVWWSDWEKTEQRDRALEAAFEYSGMSASVTSTDKRNLSHGRRLTIHFQSGGQLVVWLDQGWSYWALAKHLRNTGLTSFNMRRPADSLGETLLLRPAEV